MSIGDLRFVGMGEGLTDEFNSLIAFFFLAAGGYSFSQVNERKELDHNKITSNTGIIKNLSISDSKPSLGAHPMLLNSSPTQTASCSYDSRLEM